MESVKISRGIRLLTHEELPEDYSTWNSSLKQIYGLSQLSSDLFMNVSHTQYSSSMSKRRLMRIVSTTNEFFAYRLSMLLIHHLNLNSPDSSSFKKSYRLGAISKDISFNMDSNSANTLLEHLNYALELVNNASSTSDVASQSKRRRHDDSLLSIESKVSTSLIENEACRPLINALISILVSDSWIWVNVARVEGGMSGAQCRSVFLRLLRLSAQKKSFSFSLSIRQDEIFKNGSNSSCLRKVLYDFSETFASLFPQLATVPALVRPCLQDMLVRSPLVIKFAGLEVCSGAILSSLTTEVDALAGMITADRQCEENALILKNHSVNMTMSSLLSNDSNNHRKEMKTVNTDTNASLSVVMNRKSSKPKHSTSVSHVAIEISQLASDVNICSTTSSTNKSSKTNNNHLNNKTRNSLSVNVNHKELMVSVAGSPSARSSLNVASPCPISPSKPPKVRPLSTRSNVTLSEHDSSFSSSASSKCLPAALQHQLNSMLSVISTSNNNSATSNSNSIVTNNTPKNGSMMPDNYIHKCNKASSSDNNIGRRLSLLSTVAPSSVLADSHYVNRHNMDRFSLDPLEDIQPPLTPVLSPAKNTDEDKNIAFSKKNLQGDRHLSTPPAGVQLSLLDLNSPSVVLLLKKKKKNYSNELESDASVITGIDLSNKLNSIPSNDSSVKPLYGDNPLFEAKPRHHLSTLSAELLSTKLNTDDCANSFLPDEKRTAMYDTEFPFVKKRKSCETTQDFKGSTDENETTSIFSPPSPFFSSGTASVEVSDDSNSNINFSVSVTLNQANPHDDAHCVKMTEPLLEHDKNQHHINADIPIPVNQNKDKSSFRPSCTSSTSTNLSINDFNYPHQHSLSTSLFASASISRPHHSHLPSTIQTEHQISLVSSAMQTEPCALLADDLRANAASIFTLPHLLNTDLLNVSSILKFAGVSAAGRRLCALAKTDQTLVSDAPDAPHCSKTDLCSHNLSLSCVRIRAHFNDSIAHAQCQTSSLSAPGLRELMRYLPTDLLPMTPSRCAHLRWVNIPASNKLESAGRDAYLRLLSAARRDSRKNSCFLAETCDNHELLRYYTELRSKMIESEVELAVRLIATLISRKSLLLSPAVVFSSGGLDAISRHDISISNEDRTCLISMVVKAREMQRRARADLIGIGRVIEEFLSNNPLLGFSFDVLVEKADLNVVKLLAKSFEIGCGGCVDIDVGQAAKETFKNCMSIASSAPLSVANGSCSSVSSV